MTTSICMYVSQAGSVEVKNLWVTDIRRLLQNQSDMKNGLYSNSSNDTVADNANNYDVSMLSVVVIYSDVSMIR